MYKSGSNVLSCKNIHFNIADSVNTIVDIDANVPANTSEGLQFHLHAKNISVVDLHAILQLFRLNTKDLDNWHLSGKIADIDLSIKGTTHAPVFAVEATPDDLIFTLPNLKQAIHANAGKIVYTNEVFSLERVNLFNQNSKCVISIGLNHHATASKLEKLSLIIENADLNAVQNYSSSLASTSLVIHGPI